MFTGSAILRLIYILLLTLSANTHGQSDAKLPAVFKLSEIQNTDISQSIEYFKYPSGTLPKQNFDLAQWRKTLVKHDNTNPMGDRYVAVFTLANDTNEKSWFVYPYGSPVEHIQLAQYADSNLISNTASGVYYNNPIQFHYGGNIELGIDEQATIALLFDSQTFVAPIKIVVKPEHAATKQFGIENIILILSLGVCFALGLYNCFLYLGTGSKQYLYYALSTFGFTFSWAFTFGVVNYFIPSLSLVWGTVGFSLGFHFAVWFAIAFLGLDKRSAKVYLYLKLLAWCSFLPSIVAIFNIGLGGLLVSVFGTVVLLTNLFFGLQSWKRGYRPARYFVLALLFVLVPGILVNLINLNILPGYNINAMLFALLGNSFDSLLLAFALAEKVRLTNIQNAELTHELELNVQQRTSQLLSANGQLESLILELREANLAKTHFLASMSHEIRTPLTSIIGYAQSIQNKEVQVAKQPEVIDIIADNGSHLLSVINDILDISKIEANKLDFENIPTPLLSIVEQIETVMHKRALDKGIEFITDYHFPLPDLVMSDPTRLRQILFNLTNNALKFTEQGKVVLSVRFENNALLFKLTDTGIGMTDAQIDSLFVPFQQAESSISRKYGGTGLGLSISKHLAQGLGGIIAVKSQINLGSEFELTMPVTLCQEATMVENIDGYTKVKEPIAKQNRQTIDFNRARVLIVDDHPDVRKLTTLLLENMNCDVTSASSGIETLEIVSRDKPFQLILLDIQMPELDGNQTLIKLREIGCKAPVVAFTANNTEQEIEHYAKVGFSDYLAKPIDRVQFQQILSYYLHASIGNKSLLTAEQQQQLSKEYYTDLIPSLEECIQAIELHNVHTQKKICHSIKGSAASFGFDLFADVFTELEQALNEDNEENCKIHQNKISLLTKRYTNPPYVNIRQGIINHQLSLNKFQSQFQEFLNIAKQQMQLLQQAVDNLQLPMVRTLLIKLDLEINKYALEGLTQHTDMIGEYLEIKSQDQTLYNKQLSMMLRKFKELNTWFNQ